MLTPGQNFAHFRILQKLGEGGMGEVYLAEDTKLGRRVALKTLRDDYFDNQERRDRFEREAKTAAQISHANVMAIYDIGSALDQQSRKEIGYIVMEYVKGRTLTEYVTGLATDTGALLRLAEKIASGLAAAHRMSIVHRDIKAENILIDEHDEPKILDFGLAKAIEPLQMEGPVTGDTVKKQLTTAGTVVGTVACMSPEQVRGEAVDSRSDIFSFGVLLYKMFTGEMPFSGSTQVSILAKILEAQHPPLHTMNKNINPELERIIDKCLQKSPNDRYQDTRDLVIDLRNLRRQYDSGISSSTSSVTAQIDSAVRQDRKKQRTKRLIRAGIILVSLFLFLRLVGLVPLRMSVSSGPDSVAQAGAYSLAILGFDNKTGDAELDWLKTGLPEILLTDLAQDQSMNIISQRRLVEELGGDGHDLEEYSYEEQVKAARRLGAVNVVSGSIFKLGDKIRIDARLEDVASGKILLAEKVVSDDPMKLVDSLAARMVSALNMREQVAAGSVSEVTTHSAEAYRYYHLGMQKFLDELFDEAIVDLRKAVALDSTFALAYMRIGMSYVFNGRVQDGVPYFAQAKRHDSHLPPKERSLIDVYSEIWLKQNFDVALTKMKTLVDSYPDDKESKTVYALLRWQLNKDTTGALQLFQEVLKQDPKYQLALTFLVQCYESQRNYDKAVEYTKQLQQYHPESPAAARKLGELYTLQDRFDEAIAAYNDVLRRFPGDADALSSLIECYIKQHDFANADRYVEEYREAHDGDAFRMVDYYRWKANLANWSGKFNTSMKYRFSALTQAYETRDSARIVSALQTISNYYQVFDMLDSAAYYHRKSLPWSGTFQRLSYAVGLVGINRAYVDEVRALQREYIAVFRSRIPENLQPLGDGIQMMFDGYVAADTAMVIEGLQLVYKVGGSSTDTRRGIGELYVLTGKYKEGIEWLQPVVSGNDRLTSGFFYPYENYMIGVANEALGNKQEAVKDYQEMLKYWSNPEIELKEIKDARARLARLTA